MDACGIVRVGQSQGRRSLPAARFFSESFLYDRRPYLTQLERPFSLSRKQTPKGFLPWRTVMVEADQGTHGTVRGRTIRRSSHFPCFTSRNSLLPTSIRDLYIASLASTAFTYSRVSSKGINSTNAASFAPCRRLDHASTRSGPAL